MPPSQAQNLMKQLKENWFLIFFLASLIIGWTNFTNRLALSEENQREVTTKIEELAKDNAELKNAIIEIKANYIFIKEALSRN